MRELHVTYHSTIRVGAKVPAERYAFGGYSSAFAQKAPVVRESVPLPSKVGGTTGPRPAGWAGA